MKIQYLIKAIELDLYCQSIFQSLNFNFKNLDKFQLINFEEVFFDQKNQCQLKSNNLVDCKLKQNDILHFPEIVNNNLQWFTKSCCCSYDLEIKRNFTFVYGYHNSEYKLNFNDLKNGWKIKIINEESLKCYLTNKQGLYLKGENSIGKSYASNIMANYYAFLGLNIGFVDIPNLAIQIGKYESDIKNSNA